MNIILSIPDGHLVVGCDLDADEPYCQIVPIGSLTDMPDIVPIPKELAYYLRTHWCGSKLMHGTIAENARRQIRNQIKAALGMDE